MKKKIAILGSTGSIGKSLIEIIKKDKKNFEIILLSADENYKELLKQAKFFKVKNLIISNTKSFNKIKKDNYSKKIKIYNNFEDSRKANQALENHLMSIDNQWTIQDEVDWWEENQQYSIKNWRDSEEYLQLMSDKSQNTLNPDPDFVISDSYPKNVLRKHCDSL